MKGLHTTGGPPAAAIVNMGFTFSLGGVFSGGGQKTTGLHSFRGPPPAARRAKMGFTT